MRHLLICVSLYSLVGGISGCSRPVEIIAHRGASYLAPENTMSSVLLGWEKQADVEVDVHLSEDGHVVVIHDASTKHITGMDLEVKGTTLEELRELDFGSHKGPEFTGERIPLLSEVLATIPPGRKLYVEIKCGKEIGVCTHCFSSEVHDIVYNGYPELEHEFLLHFNYYLGG